MIHQHGSRAACACWCGCATRRRQDGARWCWGRRARARCGDNGPAALEGQGFRLDHPHTASTRCSAGRTGEAEGEHDAAAANTTPARRARRPIRSRRTTQQYRLAQEKHGEAIIAYQRALARDGDFAEARYNLALAYEAQGKIGQAAEELERALAIDPLYYDAMFNLGQLRLKDGDIATAKYHFERYLASNPPADWAATARKAITYCTARLSA